MSDPVTGGCQCGAVRFAAASLGRAAICHCRMCQKAFGGFYAPLVTGIGVEWTRGRPKYFHSSNTGRRGFCGDCGTPLTYEAGDGVELAIGALDDPEAAAPVLQVNPNDKLSFVDAIPDLPTRPVSEKAPLDVRMPGFVNNQHPDHDTPDWPPEGRR
ncbi:MAG: GFA family protein [Flavobacteriaceae bacterium]